jgi:hypothetical protein
MAGKDIDDAKVKQFLVGTMDGFFRYFAGETYPPLPGKALKAGEKWPQSAAVDFDGIGKLGIRKTLIYQGKANVGNRQLDKITATADYTFTPAKEGGPLPFSVRKGTLKKGEYQGIMYFDAAAGRLVQSDVIIKTEMSLTMVISDKELDADSRRTQSLSVRVSDQPPK